MNRIITALVAVGLVLGVGGIAGAALSGSAYETAVLNGGGSGNTPVLYYGLDESGSSNFDNHSSLSPVSETITGTPVGGSASAHANLGTSVTYDRSPVQNESIALGPAIQTGATDPSTVIFWFKANTINATRELMIKGSDGNDSDGFSWKSQHQSNGQFRFARSNGSTSNNFSHPTLLVTGTWYFAAYAWDGGATGAEEFYLAPFGSPFPGSYTTNTDAARANTNNIFYVGGAPNTAPGAGVRSPEADIDEVAVYGAFLTSAQLQTIFEAATADAPAVPEPATMGLLAVGGLAVLIRRRRR